jgi:hypothetical protein
VEAVPSHGEVVVVVIAVVAVEVPVKIVVAMAAEVGEATIEAELMDLPT